MCDGVGVPRGEDAVGALRREMTEGVCRLVGTLLAMGVSVELE